MNKHIRKISNATMIGSMGILVLASMQGCGGDTQQAQQPNSSQQNVVKEGATVTIQEYINKDTNKTTYKIIDEVPSVNTRVILRDVNGTERILSQAEIDKLVKEEEKRVEAGTSNLTKSPEEVRDSGGLGLAGTLMASMAAGMVGSMLMNKLMNNQNYQQNRRMSYRSPSVYSRSQSSFAKARANNRAFKRASSTRRSGFGTSTRSSSRSSGFGRTSGHSGFGG